MENYTKIASSKKLEAGDHIYIIITMPIVYEHHGIYIGNDKVIHLANVIVECNLNKFACGLVVRRASEYGYQGYPIPYTRTKITQRFQPKEIVQRAKSKLGTGLYSLEEYNDEHFVSWCVCGVYCSD